jgi:peptidoglycan/LPS O-acetylase OafA/YrhL
MDYRREIDGLRALAVLPVILFHAGFQTFSGGFVGVDIFFVISGYLITSIIIAELEAGTFTVINFYERRARRILPALFVVMFACLPFAWFWLLPGDMKEFSQSLIAVTAFVSNILFWKTIGYFDAATELRPLLHTWSLAVEEQYYLLFPPFLMLAWRFGKNTVLAVLIVVTITSFALAQWGSVNKPAPGFYLLPTRGWELLVGAFIAIYFSKEIQPFQGKTINQVGGAAGLLLIGYAIFYFDKQTPFPGMYALVPTVGAALIILFATPQTWVGKLLASNIFVGVGLISYSAYLWHQPLLAFARHKIPGEPSIWLMGTLSASAILLAFVSWKYVETPFRNKRRFSQRQIFAYGAAFGAFFIAVGLIGNQTTGFVYRYEKNDRYLASLQKSEVGKYVERRFGEFLMRPFDAADSRKKILIVGDSYAQDLVNALFEAGLTRHIQLSTRHISHLCGNIFIEQHEFVNRISKDDMRRCQGKSLFEDAQLRKLMADADEIWFASAWQYWQAELIQRSVANIEKYLAKPVKVFGRKDFGRVDIKELLGMTEAQRLANKNQASAEVLRTNALMRKELGPNVFIDVQQLMCGTDEEFCPLFDQNLSLISYDGGHLTESGAKYCGDRLAAHQALRGLWGDSIPFLHAPKR